jgi:hypothetical protein
MRTLPEYQSERDLIAKEGEEIRSEITAIKIQGQDTEQLDKKVLSFLSKLINHEQKYKNQETPELRKKNLYNIARTVALLLKNLKSKYEKNFGQKQQDGLFYDIEFLVSIFN